jgi:tetratricopeptide (TPR) repeat protein
MGRCECGCGDSPERKQAYHLTKSGRYGEALVLLTQLLCHQKHILPPDHEDLAYTYADLGEVYSFLGLSAEAEISLRKALSIRRKNGHKGNFDDNLNSLGRLAIERGEWAEAEKLLREELAIRRESVRVCNCDNCNHELGRCLGMLGLALRGSGAMDEAAAVLEESVRVCDLVRDSEEPQNAGVRLQSLTVLGSLLFAKKDFAAAELLQRRVVALTSAGDKKFPQQLINHVACLFELGRFAEALAICERAKDAGDPSVASQAADWIRTCKEEMRLERLREDKADHERQLRQKEAVAAIPESLRAQMIAELIDEDENPKSKKKGKGHKKKANGKA